MTPPDEKKPDTPEVEPTEATDVEPSAAAASPEDASAAEAGTAAADAPADDAGSRPASAADAPPADTVAEDEPEAEAEPVAEAEPAAEASDDDSSAAPAEKPKRRRSRRSTEPKAEDAPAVEAEKPSRARGSQPAPTRRRSRRPEGEPAPVVRAQAKYVRSSARKARLVCDHIRGKSVDEARAILALTPRAIARDWSKLLESAVANAEHNHELVGEDLYVKAVHADEGPTIKRFRPRAMGRATQIRKRTSHLTILLTQKD